jgi:hypothetical protein
MNVIAKSTTLSPFLRATATVVSNGGMPVVATGKVSKPKVSVPQPVRRTLQQTAYQDLLTGPTCISSGVSGESEMSACSAPECPANSRLATINESTRYICAIRDYIIDVRTLQIATLSVELSLAAKNILH